MAEQLNFKIGGLSNTRDSNLVGTDCFSMDNVELNAGIINAVPGYSMQIASVGASGSAVGFGRYDGVARIYSAIDGTIRTAHPASGSWTTVTTGLTHGEYDFEQFGPTMFIIGPEGSLYHTTIGGTDWTGGEPTAPESGSKLYPVEGVYNGFSGTSFQNRQSIWNLSTGSEMWSFEWDPLGGGYAFPSDAPTYSETVGRNWIFDINGQYAGPPDPFEFTSNYDHARGPGTVDFSESHMWVQDVFYMSSPGIVDDDSLYMYFTDTSGSKIFPTSINEQYNKQTPGGFLARRESYFAGLDTNMSIVDKVTFGWSLFMGYKRIRPDAQVAINISRGDVAMNDLASPDLDAGTIKDSIQYKYTVTRPTDGIESNLSVETATSPVVPTDNITDSCYMRIGLDPISNMPSGSILTTYRKRKSDGAFVKIGATSENTGSAFKKDNQTGNIFVDDHYQEWELDDLEKYEAGFTIDTTITPTAIGKFRASLGLGVDKNLWLSKVDRPNEFEPVNEAPDPNDFNQGRSVYVDDSRSEDINGVHGSNVLYVTTKNRVYILRGDFPKDLSAPKAISNNGPIGGKTSTLWRDGLAFVDNEAIWFVRYSDDAQAVVGNLVADEITKDVKTSFSALSVDSSAVLLNDRGNLYLFAGTKYMKLDRQTNYWQSGTLNHSVVDGFVDYEENMRLLTDEGGLIKWNDGTTYAGSDITWNYSTGDRTLERCRIVGIKAISSGSPSLFVTMKDGSYGSTTKHYVLDDDHNVYPIDVSRMQGTKLTVSASGSQGDAIMGLQIDYEYSNQGKGR